MAVRISARRLGHDAAVVRSRSSRYETWVQRVVLHACSTISRLHRHCADRRCGLPPASTLRCGGEIRGREGESAAGGADVESFRRRHREGVFFQLSHSPQSDRNYPIPINTQSKSTLWANLLDTIRVVCVSTRRFQPHVVRSQAHSPRSAQRPHHRPRLREPAPVAAPRAPFAPGPTHTPSQMSKNRGYPTPAPLLRSRGPSVCNDCSAETTHRKFHAHRSDLSTQPMETRSASSAFCKAFLRAL